MTDVKKKTADNLTLACLQEMTSMTRTAHLTTAVSCGDLTLTQEEMQHVLRVIERDVALRRMEHANIR